MSALRRPALLAALLFALPCALLAPPARAYRPFNSTDAAVAAKGEVELEVGPAGYLHAEGSHSLVAPALVFNLGFSEGYELVLEGRQLWLLGDGAGPRYRLDDTILSVKHVLRDGVLQEKTGLSVATELGVLLPELNGSGGAGVQLAVIASHRWEWLTLHANGLVAWSREHTVEATGGLILEGPEAWPVRPVAELMLEGEPRASAEASALVGAIWKAGEALSIDCAVRVGRAGGETLTEVRLGFTWSFAAWEARAGPRPE
jgi:hypothetical protein